ncbi:Eukaryotic protein of unknown function (DUF829) [Seminavis robusta]|uniref:Transmembrane protein 53 n=1 Tax=Seminavis robusta TaxID=568900 RepID=A0A9N8ENL1_9STRA|nr:Eukaryotic protein of unknown function (DUF829) [Seminavis robusta]|eukprot:Sro1291_g259890.1 Eukaryotic protein of unknown function (DUF829) (311) ;mRNA; r:8439-9371
MSKRKPLVVLAGWLGCQKKSLRRYDHLFSQLGCDVFSAVAPPAMVVGSCYSKPILEPLTYPPQWPAHGWSPESMQGVAWEVLRYIHNHNCEYFVFYAFSNGGCFVWEQLSRILYQHHDLIDNENETNIDPSSMSEMDADMAKGRRKLLGALQQKAAGVVFDSCPSQELGEVSQALTMCSFSERLQVMRMPADSGGGLDVAFFPSMVSAEKKERANQRGAAYHHGLKTDPCDIPQLYLYSENDALIPSTGIDEIYNHRRETIGADRILRRKWESSRHCAHLIDHPNDYETTMKEFLQLTQDRHNTKPHSKL